MTNYQSWNNFEPKNNLANKGEDSFWQPAPEAAELSETAFINVQQLQLYALNENGEALENFETTQKPQAHLQISHQLKPKTARSHFEEHEQPALESCLKRRYVRISRKRSSKPKNSKRVAVSRLLVTLMIVLNCFSLYQQSELKQSLKKQEALLMGISGQINKLSNLYKNLSENQKSFFQKTASKIEARLSTFQYKFRAPKAQTFAANLKRKTRVNFKKNTYKPSTANTKAIATNTPNITTEKPENLPKPAFEKAEQAQEAFAVIRASSEPQPSNSYSYDELFMNNVPVARE